MKFARDLIFLVCSIGLVALYALSVNGFPLDDSWIHQTFGRNLAQLGQWSFIPNDPVAASTSPVYTLLLSLGYKLNIPYMFWTHAIGVLQLTMAGMVASRMADKAYPHRYSGLMTGLAVIFSWHLIWSAASGMETLLFGVLMMLGGYVAWGEGDANRAMTPKAVMLRGGVFGLVVAIGMATRPEGILMGGVVGLCMVLAHPHPHFRLTILWDVGAFIAFSIGIAPYLWLNWDLNGTLLPNTNDAKFAEVVHLFEYPYLIRLREIVEPIIAGAQAFFILGAIYFVWMNRKKNRLMWLYIAPLAWAIGHILLYAARLPVPIQHGRYLIPMLPTFVAMGAIGMITMVIEWRENMLGRVLSRALALSTIATSLVFAFSLGLNAYVQDVAIINEEMVDMAKWVAENLPPDELFATHDIGALGYFATRPLLDTAGLITPEIIPYITADEPLWEFMRQRGAVYFMAFPFQIPNRNPKDPRLCLIYQSPGKTILRLNEPKMSIYRFNWDGTSC